MLQAHVQRTGLSEERPLKLKCCDFTLNLQPQLAEILQQKKNIHSYKKKQVLFYEGNPIMGVYCLQSGRAKVYKLGPEGKEYILSIVCPGEMVGLESVFGNDCYITSAEMIEDGMVRFIELSHFMAIVRQNPTSAMKVIEILARNLRASEEERLDLAQRAVRERMARLLSLLSERYGIPVKNGIRIGLRLSREEMAEMIGTAVETTMRLLKEFKEEQAVTIQGKEIIVLDKKRLEKTAHFTDAVL